MKYSEMMAIREKIARLPKKKITQKEREFLQRYLGSQKKFLGATTSDLIKIAKEIVREQKEFKNDKLVRLLDHLFASQTLEEQIAGGKILTFLKPDVRMEIPFVRLRKWLAKAEGWLEIDVICQSSYTATEVLGRWNEWREMIEQFSQNKNISLRRASLVLQIPSVRKANEIKLRQLAFETIEILKNEKEGLIIKAVSWLLRSLSELNKNEVKQYILKNESNLPRIAFRETMKKIETGKKTSPKVVAKKEQPILPPYPGKS